MLLFQAAATIKGGEEDRPWMVSRNSMTPLWRDETKAVPRTRAIALGSLWVTALVCDNQTKAPRRSHLRIAMAPPILASYLDETSAQID
jgi:hypothetical protein